MYGKEDLDYWIDTNRTSSPKPAAIPTGSRARRHSQAIAQLKRIGWKIRALAMTWRAFQRKHGAKGAS